MKYFHLLVGFWCQLANASPYPPHWWHPVSKELAYSWEVLPQEAGPNEVILSKRNELGLMSNFAATPFEFHGRHFSSLEGLWQSMLYPEDPSDERSKFPGIRWAFDRSAVEKMVSFGAKSAGDLAFANMRRMKINWVSFNGKKMDYWVSIDGKGTHYDLIKAATLEKVKQNSKVKEVLLATGSLILRPDHHQEKGAPPAWRYFEILMEIRNDLLTPKLSKN